MERVSVVTGAARGIGRACAERLGRLGPVLLTDLDATELEAAVGELRRAGIDAHGDAADLTDPQAVHRLRDRVAERWELGALVHCAGLAPVMVEDPYDLIDVNLVATVALVDAFEELCREGSVAVCVASISAYRGLPADLDDLLADPRAPGFRAALERRVDLAGKRRLAYAISKRGVQVLCERRAHAWAAAGARICSLSPGGVTTRMAAGGPLTGTDTAIGRRADPAELAAVAAFLVSPEASYITGSDILVDGGARAGYLHHAADAARDHWLDASRD